MPEPQNGGFTAVSGPGGPETTGLTDAAASLESDSSRTRTGTLDQSATTSASSTGDAAASAAATSPTTFSTSVSSADGNDVASSTTSIASSTAANAASNTSSGAVTVTEKSCNSIGCSTALKAAIAVPIVVAAIAGILLIFFCARRRRKSGGGAALSEKKPKKGGKKWSRHLRAFSFDAELLMGGRFSSSNSIRSRDPSVRSAATNPRNGTHSAEPSLHSIEEVAPPYRDAVSHVQPPSPTQARTVPPVTSIAADPIPRPSSTATAPPPYRSIVGETMTEPPTPASARNPFADSAPVSPIEGSPFNDPPEDEEAAGGLQPTLSRGSSLYQSVSADDDATPTQSEAGSIRQAVLGRRVSARATDSTGGGGS
ncbi:uncharacterized protein Z518_02429 [Rhinocladiella mackenziei CBS 650.93]|uniref:Uncharacterized protein n=1 Tax=Rhinocladiella mackenziei CBS 650.93 TaxID=1442369 RepID=A0A0D2JF00_9EURO|nr:uncharacterized protein Z518_02429 [Rhinocladiella mackenziei CBS 650.93]KIX07775.1 hypothetical protein Z518_02429 [Rhinocladiella mackenziei CBS 650.93]